ncbi:MAG: hypothetical protein IPL52_14655 [Flavobacteriales bacterium]|nr:hypothetical protein [Flavobacteriales bacterium]
MRDGSNTFTVTLGDPNGRKDQRPADNTLSVPFLAAADSAFTGRIRFRLRTAGGRRNGPIGEHPRPDAAGMEMDRRGPIR